MKNRETAPSADPVPNVSITFHLTPSKLLDDDAHVPPGTPSVVATALAKLTPELRKVLRENERELLRWIATSRENASAFAMDPIATLAKAAPRIPPAAVEQLAKIRGERPAVQADLPGIRLTRVSVDVAAPVKQGR